jgi:predicted O-methyltransferase YrrM
MYMDENLTYPNVQNHLRSLIPEYDPVIQEMDDYARENNFPIIGPAVGQLCYQIVNMLGSKHIYEMGSGYGYSTAWFARALKERFETYPSEPGLVHHVVWDENLSQMAQNYLLRMGLQDYVEYHVGEAIAALEEFEDETFDVIFCDIDKDAYPKALPVIKEKLQPTGVLIIDNMLWHGRIFDDDDQSPSTKGVREFTSLITTDPDWIVSLFPIRDGVILAYKR